ncbi:glycosyltransferase family 2 protein [Propionimicrobium sp. PCR01-08-3]|uniref:glycosyltransferase family 2 protein n=1 Tax=Propionimicrobium sp. PCR01-08-3 TaxID=3052086 RepID=UPI00255C4B17|nr:glycosyltransferase family 2 protein [Propionimicrobium sp. PCR01-08-3]WIY82643.1 glycosyltransferase family 2 protein [Propionimicrobium sp. PCR01-08-3]
MTKIVAVVVTYRAGEGLRGLLTELNRQCDLVIVVDNGSGTDALTMVRFACEGTGSRLIALEENLGIAAAQNRGIAMARQLGASHVLLSDHDSLPDDGMVAKLLAAIEQDPRIAAAGPLAAEDREGGDQLVYMARTWSPKRATAEELSRPQLDVAFLIASGCLITISALDEIGGMNEPMFIDHVDLEWGLRARRAGYRLVAVPSAHLHHSLGDEVVQLPRRAQPIHVHAPFRNYYLARNTIYLIKTNLMPWRWRVRYCYWLAKYVAFNSLLVDRLPERRRMLWRGIRDGIRGRMGRLAD